MRRTYWFSYLLWVCCQKKNVRRVIWSLAYIKSPDRCSRACTVVCTFSSFRDICKWRFRIFTFSCNFRTFCVEQKAETSIALSKITNVTWFKLEQDDKLWFTWFVSPYPQPLKWELKQQPGMSPPRGGFKPDDPNQQIVAEDIFDEYGGLNSFGCTCN